jgi:YD repeat-containing protein
MANDVKNYLLEELKSAEKNAGIIPASAPISAQDNGILLEQKRKPNELQTFLPEMQLIVETHIPGTQGKLAKFKDQAGNVEQNEYDSQGRLTSVDVTRENGTKIHQEYCAATGNLQSYDQIDKDKTSHDDRVYNDAGRLVISDHMRNDSSFGQEYERKMYDPQTGHLVSSFSQNGFDVRMSKTYDSATGALSQLEVGWNSVLIRQQISGGKPKGQSQIES